jgi:hypothetical protein
MISPASKSAEIFSDFMTFQYISLIQLFEKLKTQDLWAGFLAGWPKPQQDPNL